MADSTEMPFVVVGRVGPRCNAVQQIHDKSNQWSLNITHAVRIQGCRHVDARRTDSILYGLHCSLDAGRVAVKAADKD